MRNSSPPKASRSRMGTAPRFSSSLEGDLGPVNGFQWRHFCASCQDCDADYTGKGVDQLQECIYKIKHNPTDRRIILSAWNPAGTSSLQPNCLSTSHVSDHSRADRYPQHGAPTLRQNILHGRYAVLKPLRAVGYLRITSCTAPRMSHRERTLRERHVP